MEEVALPRCNISFGINITAINCLFQKPKALPKKDELKAIYFIDAHITIAVGHL